MDKEHIAYWKIFPTIDHVVPVSRGGPDDESNWVCCSMTSNSIKSNWLLSEIGWHLQDSGNLKNWDGMFFWFLEHVNKNLFLLEEIPYIKTWYKAATDVSSSNSQLLLL